MTSRATTGDLARATSLSEKAIRLYADRGLLRAEREPGTGARVFDGAQVERARRIALLRSLNFSLAEVASVLDSPDPVAAFDELWSGSLRRAERAVVDAHYTRAIIAGTPTPVPGVPVGVRAQRERLLLTLGTSATLPGMAAALGAATAEIFAALVAADMPLDGPVHVEIRSRATESFPAELLVCAPVVDLLRPPVGMSVTTDPAHTEVFVELTQAQANDQGLIVALHDQLSAGGPLPDGRGDAHPCGNNREVYFPTFGTGAAGTVMEIAVPVRGPVPSS